VPDMSKIFPKRMPAKKICGKVSSEKLVVMLQETCVAEMIHGILMLTGFGCVHLWPGAGGWILALVNALLGNLPFVLIQRYNRPRLVHMLNGSRSVLLDLQSLPHRPVLDIASAYKNAHREAMIAEYRVGKGKLLICSLHLTDTDPAACWLKNRILSYGASSAFQPAQTLSEEQFISLCKASPVVSEKNSNEARNKNDITA